jgi:hypothetical protein
MRGFLALDQRLTAETTNVRTVVVPKQDEEVCKKVQMDLIAEGYDSVRELTFVGATTIWDAVKVVFPSTKATPTTTNRGGGE